MLDVMNNVLLEVLVDALNFNFNLILNTPYFIANHSFNASTKVLMTYLVTMAIVFLITTLFLDVIYRNIFPNNTFEISNDGMGPSEANVREYIETCVDLLYYYFVTNKNKWWMFLVIIQDMC